MTKIQFRKIKKPSREKNVSFRITPDDYDFLLRKNEYPTMGKLFSEMAKKYRVYLENK